MDEQDRDDVEQVSVHELWEHEAYDFTPWLAKPENLDRLGDELGLSLSNARCEVQVGSYYLDILADETDTGTKVAIENQLKGTNIHHLGQLLTYIAGRDTRIGIWVASKFRCEHAQALDWLNRWTADEISFYGVKIEAIRRTADSDTEARFRKVVWPGGWNKKLSPPGPTPDDREGFFRRLYIELRRTRFTDQRPYKLFGTGGGRYYRSQVNEGISYGASVWLGRRRLVVVVHIRTKRKAFTKHVFDRLEENRAALECQVNADAGLDWSWKRHNPHRFSSILISTEGSIGDGEQEAKMWIVEHLHKLKEVFDPRIKTILQESQGVAGLTLEDLDEGSSSKGEAEPPG